MKRIFEVASVALMLAILVWAASIYCGIQSSPPQSQSASVDAALYVTIAAVYDGDLNGSTAALVSKEVLEAAAPTFVNVPILLAHEHGDPDKCVGRSTAAKLAFDTVKNQYYLEVSAKIVDPTAITKIKSDLYHSVSVSFIIDDATCSIDDLNVKECPHRGRMGQPYKVNDKWVVARAVLKRVTGLEVSFVNVPGSAGARILNSSSNAPVLSASK